MPIISCENRVVSKADQVPAGVRNADIASTLDPHKVIHKSLLDSTRYRFVSDNVITFSKLKEVGE